MKPFDVRVICIRFVESCLVSAAVLTAAQPVAAQTQPAPPDGIRRLAPYIGVWEGEGTLTMDGTPHPFKLRHEWVAFADGWGIQVHEADTSPDMPAYLSENLIGVDPGTGRIHLFTVSNAGETHDHSGTWADDRHFTLEYNGIQDGKPMTEVIPVSLDGPDQYSLRSTVTVGGAEASVLVATMHRVPSPPGR